MRKRRVIFLVGSVLFFVVAVVGFVVIVSQKSSLEIPLIGKVGTDVSASSTVPGVKIRVSNPDSFYEIIDSLLIPSEGVYDQDTKNFVKVKYYQIVLANEKQPLFTLYGIDQSEENYLTSGSFSVSDETLYIFVHLNLQHSYVQENKNFILNQQVVQGLLTASSKKAANITYDRDGAYEITSRFSESEDNNISYPVLIVE